MHADHYDHPPRANTPLWGLPDPVLQPEFYRDVPGKRAIAWFIDALLISLVVGIVVVFTVGIGLFFIGFLFLMIGFAYRVITIAGASATPGMRLMAIELRTGRGERFDLPMAFLHTLGYSLSVSFVFPQILSIILMATTPRGQGLTDLVLGTTAINRTARM